MKWSRLSDYCLQSDCKRYTVGKFNVAEGWLYECWRGDVMLACRLPTADEAKALCEADKHAA